MGWIIYVASDNELRLAKFYSKSSRSSMKYMLFKTFPQIDNFLTYFGCFFLRVRELSDRSEIFEKLKFLRWLYFPMLWRFQIIILWCSFAGSHCYELTGCNFWTGLRIFTAPDSVGRTRKELELFSVTSQSELRKLSFSLKKEKAGSFSFFEPNSLFRCFWVFASSQYEAITSLDGA